MLYPVCPTCKMLLADKQIPYEKAMEELSNKNLSDKQISEERRKLFEKLGITRYCCKMRFISYVDHSKVVV
jgi:DNA-directed RNA polymerase subunit N (RpoN/RPB10)